MQLRVRGVSLALDDLDTGRTSCQHLLDFRFDMLKIDGGFISGIDQSPDNQILVSALTGIGRQFDMMVIAEYVETAQEARVLRNLGVDGFQGYLFGKPTLIWDKGQSSNRVNA
jgi:EAL domain-containing protein (putative c-di-GMP-specific phosphodiesterase class I)